MEDIVSKLKELRINIRPSESKYDKNGKMIRHSFRVRGEMYPSYIVLNYTRDTEGLVVTYGDGLHVTLPIEQVVNYLIEFARKRELHSWEGLTRVGSFCNSYEDYLHFLPYVLETDHENYFGKFVESDSEFYNHLTNSEKDMLFVNTNSHSCADKLYKRYLVPFICNSLIEEKQSVIYNSWFVQKIFEGNFEVVEQYSALMRQHKVFRNVPFDLIAYRYNRLDLFQKYGLAYDYDIATIFIPEDYSVLASLVDLYKTINRGLMMSIDYQQKTITFDHSSSVEVNYTKNGNVLTIDIIYPD